MELRLIERMQNYLDPAQRAPGDDCAVLARGDGPHQLVTTDMIMDGVHFVSSEQSLTDIGYKALAVNISDIAAMAGRPEHAFVSLALPRKLANEESIDSLYRGMRRCAEPFDVAISGGDTNIWQGPLVISVTLLGQAQRGVATDGTILRSSARDGDHIMVTGPLGGSLAAGRHLRFTPRVREGQYLAERYGVRGMMDLSDGLATDLRHIIALSGVGMTLDGHALPVHIDVTASHDWQRAVHALTDGEDFELVFCCSPEDAQAIAADDQLNCTTIGVCTTAHRQLKVRWRGEEQDFSPQGYEHR